MQGQDSAVYLFAKCSITKQIWKNIEDVINSITQNPIALDPFTAINFYLAKTFESHSEQISFLLTVTNYCVWQTRNKQLNTDNLNPIDYKIILSKIFNHITIRERKDKKRLTVKYVEEIQQIRRKLREKLQSLI